MIDATDVKNAVASVETTVNALLTLKASPSTTTLAQATAAAAAARAAINAMNDGVGALNSDIDQAGGARVE